VALPFVLAGPILRRVEPNLVSVWLALSRAASVTLTLWQGRTKFSAADHLIRSDPATNTLRFGQRLHIAQALLRIPKESDKTLKPGVVYSYDVEITETVGGAKHTLASLGLLKSAPTKNGDPAALEHPHVALGYIDDFLPSFALPPDKLDDLRLVYGSCRRPQNEHPDAMAWIDDLIADPQTKLYEDALKRPHQLVLGGDQIYADDVWAAHLIMINRLGNELIGLAPGELPRSDPLGEAEAVPVERLVVDQKRLGPEDAPAPDGENPLTNPDAWAPGGSTALPAGLTEFPAGRRFQLMLREAQMTSVDGDSHLFSFGEFAAMYAMVWCNACWPKLESWPSARDVRAPRNVAPRPVAPEVERALDWDNLKLEDAGLTEKDEKNGVPGCEGLKGTQLVRCVFEQRHAVARDRLAAFVSGLPKVRRTLANVPTYMIFDDHDATDDWNLNPIWVDRVNTTSLGRAILRNALASYAVFQDWGNDPVRYLNERNDDGPAGNPKRLLGAIGAMFPEGATEGPSTAVCEVLDKLFGLDLRPMPQVDGPFDAVDPPMKWHFAVPGPKHLLVGIDNRTRRSFVSRQGPPGNVAIPAQADQIPATLPEGRELLVIVAPLQVLGPALLDELIAPTAFRIFDGINHGKLNVSKEERKEDEKQQRRAIGTRRMLGTNPDAIEAWAFDPLALEALLARLARHRKVLLLSGDVHYTAANAMSYWVKNETLPARIVQFTSSGMKNVMPWYIGAVDRVLSFAQRIVRADIGAERMGWNEKDENAFVFTGGASAADTPPTLRRRFNESPMLMPTFGWPEGTKVNPAKLPDWSWRLQTVLDLRPDAERPPPGRPRALDPSDERIHNILAQRAEPGKELAAYATIAARHLDQFDRLRHSRQILFRSNFGLVRFERAPVLTAVHEVYTALPDPDAPADDEPKPLPYMVQKASLEGSADEARPELAPFRPPAF
jgi:hypothetical protein